MAWGACAAEGSKGSPEQSPGRYPPIVGAAIRREYPTNRGMKPLLLLKMGLQNNAELVHYVFQHQLIVHRAGEMGVGSFVPLK